MCVYVCVCVRVCVCVCVCVCVHESVCVCVSTLVPLPPESLTILSIARTEDSPTLQALMVTSLSQATEQAWLYFSAFHSHQSTTKLTDMKINCPTGFLRHNFGQL